MGDFKNKAASYEMDMVHGPITSKVLIFTVPLVLTGILQLLFNAADVAVVGQFSSSNSVAAIGSTSSLINLLISLFMGIGVGVNVLVARYYAIDHKKDVSETVHTSIAVSLIAGTLLAITGIVLARRLLVLMGSPDDVIDLSTLYIRIYFLNMPANIIYNTGASILRAVGDTKRPLYFLIISGSINVFLNLITVIFFHMDVAGVALATSVSIYVSAALIMLTLIRSSGSFAFSWKKMKITPDKLKKILIVGLPAGLQGTVFSISNVLIQSSINSFGSIAMAGNAASGNIEGFVYVSMNSFYQACVTFTSQNYGVRDMERVKKVLKNCLVLVMITGLILGNSAYFFGNTLLSVFTRDPEAIAFGLKRLSVICTLYFLCGMMDTVCGSVRGLGSSLAPMIVSVVGVCMLRILWIFTVFQIPGLHNLVVLYFSYPITWIVTFTAHLVTYLILMKKIKTRAV